MKIFLCLIFFLILFVQPSRCQHNTVTHIEFSKITRGYQENIHLTPDSVRVWIDDATGGKGSSHYARKLDPAEWQRLTETLNGLKIPEVGYLPSPSMERASDGAHHSTITITTKDRKSFTHGFDDENPHDALKPLLKVIREIGPASGK